MHCFYQFLLMSSIFTRILSLAHLFYAYFTHGPNKSASAQYDKSQYSGSLAHPRGMYYCYNGKEGRKEGLHTDHFCVEFGVFVVEVERVRSVQTAVYVMCICSHECMRYGSYLLMVYNVNPGTLLEFEQFELTKLPRFVSDNRLISDSKSTVTVANVTLYLLLKVL